MPRCLEGEAERVADPLPFRRARQGLEVLRVKPLHLNLHPGSKGLRVEGHLHQGLGFIQERNHAQAAGRHGLACPGENPGVHPCLLGEGMLGIRLEGPQEALGLEGGLDFLQDGCGTGDERIDPPPHEALEIPPLGGPHHRPLALEFGVLPRQALLDFAVKARPLGGGVLLQLEGERSIQATARLQGQDEVTYGARDPVHHGSRSAKSPGSATRSASARCIR